MANAADIWTIAGFDPSGGAGILADRQVFTVAGLQSYALMTVYTAQNAGSVARVEVIDISTHSSLQPSYIAFGPIYPTITKTMRFPAQGLVKLKQWRKWVKEPLVAIGGITLANIQAVLACGVDSVAVVSAITQATNPQRISQQFLSYFSKS